MKNAELFVGWLSCFHSDGRRRDPDTFWLFFGGSTGANVFDDGDGDADTATDTYAGIPYTGYTMTINTNEYAIFSSGPDANGTATYFIPYFNAVEDLSFLSGSFATVSQLITQTGENAVVVNLCFLGGTMIATPTGERLVEELAIGDLIRTADGRDVPVIWIGRQVMAAAFANIALDEKLAPVCISAGTLDNHTDLYVSADHGMIVDGLVINASALVNGTTIRFVPAAEMPATFTYYHIETEAHDIILANGAPTETFLDAAGRAAFDNHREYLDLYGTERVIPEMRRLRITSQRLLPDAIRPRIGLHQPLQVEFEPNVKTANGR